MPDKNRTALPIAIRVYPEVSTDTKRELTKGRRWRRPVAMLVFDTETRIDATQSLIFGSYRFFVNEKCLEEGLFYADDISESDLAILKRYADEHRADAASPKLLLLSKSEFLKKLYKAAYKGRSLVVGFNLSFDLSRLVFDVSPARGRFAGGFSLGLWSYKDKQGHERRNQFRPRVAIKQIDSKRALRAFTARNQPDTVDLIPDWDSDRKNDKHTFRGNFIDLRTLAFVLTDRAYSLESACKAFGVEHGKSKTLIHGIVSEHYIDYNRRDVQVTSELAFKLLEEYDRHPIDLQVTKAFSPASLGKAYLRAVGLRPPLERQPDFPKHILGHSETAFFGGRASVHIRKSVVPVVSTDFLSMYPTVNSLMDLWRFVIARKIRCVEHCAAEIIDLLKTINVYSLFCPRTWRKLTAFVKVIPNGDVLPTRAKYSADTNDWQVGLNHLYADGHNAERDALWFTLADVVASVILTGRIPEIVDAFRIEAIGVLPGLKRVKFRGQVEINPADEDFFRVVIELRKSLSKRSDLSLDERDRLDKALKVLAN